MFLRFTNVDVNGVVIGEMLLDISLRSIVPCGEGCLIEGVTRDAFSPIFRVKESFEAVCLAMYWQSTGTYWDVIYAQERLEADRREQLIEQGKREGGTP